jgi:hypothetical protein
LKHIKVLQHLLMLPFKTLFVNFQNHSLVDLLVSDT